MSDFDHEDPDSKQLVEVAVPELYRRNGFRLLGLPGTASGSDIRRRQDRIRKLAALGLSTAPDPEDGGLLPVVPEPKVDEVEKVVHRLISDPLARLIDEVFWFWPQNDSAEDWGVQMLGNGDTKGASLYWSRRKDTE